MSIGSVVEANANQFLTLCPTKAPLDSSLKAHIDFHEKQLEFLKSAKQIQDLAKVHLHDLEKLNINAVCIAKEIFAVHESCKINGEGEFTDGKFRVTVSKSLGFDKCGLCDHEVKELIHYKLTNLTFNTFFSYTDLDVHAIEKHHNFWFSGDILNNTNPFCKSVQLIYQVLYLHE